MDIQEFVKESLVQIAFGIKGANKTLNEETNSDNKYFMLEASAHAEKRRGIEFDIAVVAKEESGAQGGAKLNIPLMAIGGDVGGKSSSENVSRVKFNVAMEWNLS
jgi:hypothetical protein